jgi:hypothetical protein
MMYCLGSFKVQKEPVQLNNESVVPTDFSFLTVMGFGNTEEEGQSSNVLLETNLFSLPHGLCMASYPEFLVNNDVMICANEDAVDRYVMMLKIAEYSTPKLGSFVLLLETPSTVVVRVTRAVLSLPKLVSRSESRHG